MGLVLFSITNARGQEDKKAQERSEKIRDVARSIFNPFVPNDELLRKIHDAIDVDFPSHRNKSIRIRTPSSSGFSKPSEARPSRSNYHSAPSSYIYISTLDFKYSSSGEGIETIRWFPYDFIFMGLGGERLRAYVGGESRNKRTLSEWNLCAVRPAPRNLQLNRNIKNATIVSRKGDACLILYQHISNSNSYYKPATFVVTNNGYVSLLEHPQYCFYVEDWDISSDYSYSGWGTKAYKMNNVKISFYGRKPESWLASERNLGDTFRLIDSGHVVSDHYDEAIPIFDGVNSFEIHHYVRSDAYVFLCDLDTKVPLAYEKKKIKSMRTPIGQQQTIKVKMSDRVYILRITFTKINLSGGRFDRIAEFNYELYSNKITGIN